MPVTIHGVPPSPFVRKARVALAEKGIDHQIEMVSPFAKPEGFEKISPLGKIPVFQDGDFTTPDSSVIIAYLERTQPSPALYPEDAQEFARALWLEEYADTKLVAACGTVFFNRFVKKNLMKQESDEAAVAAAMADEIPPVFDYLEEQVGDKEYLCGGRFSVADIAVCSPIQNLRHGGEDVDASRWPKLAAYVEKHLSRPSFKGFIEEENKMFPQS